MASKGILRLIFRNQIYWMNIEKFEAESYVPHDYEMLPDERFDVEWCEKVLNRELVPERTSLKMSATGCDLPDWKGVTGRFSILSPTMTYENEGIISATFWPRNIADKVLYKREKNTYHYDVEIQIKGSIP